MVVYRHSFVRSVHIDFVLRYLGYPDVRGYDGSWEEWGSLASLPTEVGSAKLAPAAREQEPEEDELEA